jgi:hypothetical protein
LLLGLYALFKPARVVAYLVSQAIALGGNLSDVIVVMGASTDEGVAEAKSAVP